LRADEIAAAIDPDEADPVGAALEALASLIEGEMFTEDEGLLGAIELAREVLGPWGPAR